MTTPTTLRERADFLEVILRRAGHALLSPDRAQAASAIADIRAAAEAMEAREEATERVWDALSDILEEPENMLTLETREEGLAAVEAIQDATRRALEVSS